MAVLHYAHQNGCAWDPWTCLKWLRQHGCPWDSGTTWRAALNNDLELLRWARLQQPPCRWWSRKECEVLLSYAIDPCMLVYLAQQRAPLAAKHLDGAFLAATDVTCAVLSLTAALPERTPYEVVLKIVSLAFS